MLQPPPQRQGEAPLGTPGLPRNAAWLQRKRLWAGVLAGVVVIGGGVTLLGQRRSASQQRSLNTYTLLARQGSLPGVITASGELEAFRKVNVSPKRQGVLEQLFVEEGESVQAGQALALMDSGDLNDRLEELRAQLRSAQAQLNRSQSELQRRGALIRQGGISLDDYNSARSTYLVDKAAVEAAQQRLQQRMKEKGDLTVRAPFTGVVTARFADPGAFVTPTTSASASAGASSSSIVELAQGLEAVAKVPESDIGRVQVGQVASVRVDAFPDRRFPARVRQIAPRAEKVNNVTSFEVKLQLINPPPELRIGMTADIDFNTGTLAARTLIPTVAVVTEQGKPGVLLVGPGNQPTFQAVTLGASSGKDTQILEGLKPGTRVFIDLPPWAKKKRE
ncbi:MAG: efflux RND transporter periplasmic adaptor subunit [Cyanobacteria bacterium M_surface_10_m2_179]|nr:efflux RND transporter periplasmic adaptor subunit [Cyanobacteria bacterium M_surface_10_m2_179]